jgi:hypothetical protein
MTTQDTKKRTHIKPILAAAACLLLIATGIFGGIAMGGRLNREKPSANLFTLTAYAQGEEVNLKDSPLVKTDLQLVYADGDNGGFLVAAASTGFRFEGNNVKSVTFSALNGDITYGVTNLNGNDKVINAANNIEVPEHVSLTLELEKDDIVDVTYYPTEAVDVMMSKPEKMEDLSVLPGDTIRITVTFTDGTTAAATVKTSFDSDGNLQLAYQE